MSEAVGSAFGNQESPAPTAKQVLQIFCPGAASHVDLWDHKPLLEKYHGTPMPGVETEVTFQGKNGNLMQSPWPSVPTGTRQKIGRKNHYQVSKNKPLRHPLEAHRKIGDLLNLIASK